MHVHVRQHPLCTHPLNRHTWCFCPAGLRIAPLARPTAQPREWWQPNCLSWHSANCAFAQCLTRVLEVVCDKHSPSHRLSLLQACLQPYEPGLQPHLVSASGEGVETAPRRFACCASRRLCRSITHPCSMHHSTIAGRPTRELAHRWKGRWTVGWWCRWDLLQGPWTWLPPLPPSCFRLQLLNVRHCHSRPSPPPQANKPGVQPHLVSRWRCQLFLWAAIFPAVLHAASPRGWPLLTSPSPRPSCCPQTAVQPHESAVQPHKPAVLTHLVSGRLMMHGITAWHSTPISAANACTSSSCLAAGRSTAPRARSTRPPRKFAWLLGV